MMLEVNNFIWFYLREWKVIVSNYWEEILEWNLLLLNSDVNNEV